MSGRRFGPMRRSQEWREEYTPKPGRIWLTAQRDGTDAVVRVKDEGMGIAPEMLNRVFDLFVQADASPSRAQGGLGIGLTLVKRLVELHGGSVTAHSAGLGQGSEFVVRIPAESATTEDLPSSEAAAAYALQNSPQERRVLIVDDNVDAAESIAVLLQASGFSVRCVYDGISVVSVASAYRPNVIVLDIGLPDITGYEVAKRLRAQPEFARTPIVAVTGYGQQSDRERSREAGIDHHMTKPVDPRGIAHRALLAALRRDSVSRGTTSLESGHGRSAAREVHPEARVAECCAHPGTAMSLNSESARSVLPSKPNRGPYRRIDRHMPCARLDAPSRLGSPTVAPWPWQSRDSHRADQSQNDVSYANPLV